MTSSDFERLEKELKISLPKDYKSLMAAYPFQADSFSADCLLPDDADRLLELSSSQNKLPPHSFIIGDDSEYETYFFDTSRELSTIFAFDEQSGKVQERFPNLEAYIQHCKKTDKEIRRYAKRIENRKWWQFWIPK